MPRSTDARRSQPVAHAQYVESIRILVGDYLRRKWICRRPRFLLACGSVVATPHGNPVKLRAAVYKPTTQLGQSTRTMCPVRGRYTRRGDQMSQDNSGAKVCEFVQQPFLGNTWCAPLLRAAFVEGVGKVMPTWLTTRVMV